jgi:hypothetical protein
MCGEIAAIAAGRGLQVSRGFEDLAVIVLHHFDIHGGARRLSNTRLSLV